MSLGEGAGDGMAAHDWNLIHASKPFESAFCFSIGDNIHTARHIARECGILYEADHQSLEGPVFRAMDKEELIQMLPNLRVRPMSTPFMQTSSQ